MDEEPRGCPHRAFKNKGNCTYVYIDNCFEAPSFCQVFDSLFKKEAFILITEISACISFKMAVIAEDLTGHLIEYVHERKK